MNSAKKHGWPSFPTVGDGGSIDCYCWRGLKMTPPLRTEATLSVLARSRFDSSSTNDSIVSVLVLLRKALLSLMLGLFFRAFGS